MFRYQILKITPEKAKNQGPRPFGNPKNGKSPSLVVKRGSEIESEANFESRGVKNGKTCRLVGKMSPGRSKCAPGGSKPMKITKNSIFGGPGSDKIGGPIQKHAVWSGIDPPDRVLFPIPIPRTRTNLASRDPQKRGVKKKLHDRGYGTFFL